MALAQLRFYRQNTREGVWKALIGHLANIVGRGTQIVSLVERNAVWLEHLVQFHRDIHGKQVYQKLN